MQSLAKQKPSKTEITFEALGTRWWIELDGPKASTTIASSLKSMAQEFEGAYSRFQPSSQLGVLNDSKTLPKPPLEMIDMLKYALKMLAATGGVFNISVGSLLEKNGYGQPNDPGASVSNDIYTAISISKDRIEISQSVRLDFGGFGKGWLIEKMSQRLASEGIKNYVINGGGDIAVGDQPQQLYIEHPLDNSQYIGYVIARNSSLASSSLQKRQWEKQGKAKSHIVHPGDKFTDLSLLSIHVAAKSALTADTFATVFLLIDHEKRCQLAQKFGLQFLEVRSDGSFWQTPDFGFCPNS
ncbi:MAG TPA: FAD:protein FMN transferase [Patescibacteria group bacterium]|nr:FAD:protein FMN transferase [Patescibacteria group bacterium]